jgi:glutamate formiminotransferase
VRRLVECVANFSEGRDQQVVEAIVKAIDEGAGVVILHRTMDSDHHRSVITFAGNPEAVSAAAVRAVEAACQHIDLTRHRGVHPRIGAADVVPFVPISGVTLEECVHLAWATGEEIWRRVKVPVYFYEAAARRPERTRLEAVRRGEFEQLLLDSANPERAPDIGGPGLHPTAGAVIVGARKFLIAWNVNLATTNITVARRIARSIRASSGGFPHVKALGLELASRGQTQVSMNLTDFEATPLHTVYAEIRRLAAVSGVEVAGTEIIGLVPKAALEQAAAAYLSIEGFEPSVIIENRLAEALQEEAQPLQ